MNTIDYAFYTLNNLFNNFLLVYCITLFFYLLESCDEYWPWLIVCESYMFVLFIVIVLIGV